MSFSFNLVDEPWIPCLMADGSYREFGIREALARAPDIREVVDPSPLVTVSVQRLLLAILHRNFGPRDEDEWKALWDAGAFDMGVLGPYLDTWRHRFDLFDAERPFYQVAGLADKLMTSVAKLAHELASGNNATLFDHSWDEEPRPVGPAAAARLVVSQQGFSVGGLYGAETESRVSAKAAPLVAGLWVMPRGRNLAESLVLSMVVYDPSDDQPIPGSGADMPWWEQDSVRPAGESRCRGYLDYLTWQARRVLVCPSAGPDGSPVVRHAAVTQGAELPEGRLWRDPMMAHRRAKSAKSDADPWPAVRLREDRALWRDCSALLHSLPGQGHRPAVLDHVAGFVAAGWLDSRAGYDIDVYGLCSDKAKVKLWRHERLPLPLAYLEDEALVECLAAALGAAEKAGAATQSAGRNLAGELLAPRAGEKADRDAVNRWCDGFPAERLYWSRLEVPFHRLLTRLPESGDLALAEWRELLERTALDAFDQAVAGLGSSARTLRAAVRARAALQGALLRARQPNAEASDAPEEVEYAATH